MKIEQVPLDTVVEERTGYVLPVSQRLVVISQGYNGPWSHFAMRLGYGNRLNDLRHCLDFMVPFGTAVYAAKAGRVEFTLTCFSDFYQEYDSEEGLSQNHNFIWIDHLDGTHAIYSHLQKDSEQVKRNDLVQQGQLLALTGRSGWVPVPHLHFDAFTFSEKRERHTFPVRFDDYSGTLEHSLLTKEDVA